MSQDSSHKPARLLLLEAGAQLAVEQGSALQLGMGTVCQKAGVQEALFYSYFPDQHRYLLALLLHFLDEARAEAVEAIARSAAGTARIAAAFETYWDSNLRTPPMRELAIHFRNDPDGAEILRARLRAVTLIAQHELRSIGWPRPAETAQLAGLMCVETAIAEYEAGERLPGMRHWALGYFREPRPKA